MLRLPLAQSVAIFGGRFDPIHSGHVRVVEELLNDCGFGEVWVIPTGFSAYKPAQAPAEHRLALAQVAFAHLPRVKVLNLEVTRPGNTYTADTLRTLPEGPRDRYFILGTDQLAVLNEWHDYPHFLSLCNWWVLLRKGERTPPQIPAGLISHWRQDGSYTVGELSAHPQRRMIIAPTNAPELSSTEIRRELALTGVAPPESLPRAVEEYLKEHHLYGS